MAVKAQYEMTVQINSTTDRLEEQNAEIMDGLDPEYAHFVFGLNNVFSFCRMAKLMGFGGFGGSKKQLQKG